MHDTQIMKAQRVLNTAARLVSGLHKRTKQTDLMRSCGWLNVRDLTEYHSLCQMFKTVKRGAPIYIYEEFDHCG